MKINGTRRKLVYLIIGIIILIICGAALAFAFAHKGEAVLPTSTNVVNPALLSTMEEQPQYGFDDPLWWEHAVFYEIFVRSFYDSNGDGIGDFNGITQKLDYLNDGDPSTNTDLGINAIWLMPIFPSPSYHGYDVSDYSSVNPEYGTIEDFTRLLNEAHKRGIHIIIDFVINHTSNVHPWFVSAQDPMNDYHNWYIWSSSDPGYPGPWGEKVWHKADNGLYYYGIFWSGMPDLNFENPEVTKKMEEIAHYWLDDVGVDGFRVDGARHLIEEEKIQSNTKSTIAWFQNFEKLIKKWNQKDVTVGEIWDSSYVTTSYIKSQSFDMVFDFDLANAIVTTVAMGDAQALSANIDSEVELYDYQGMATFLTNHDMNRVMSQFGEDINRMKHAATILLTIPGTPFIYYGEEIGMVGMKPDEQLRTPMQWSGENEGGFTSGQSWELPNFSYKKVNVATQVGDDSSLFSLYRNLVHTRLNHPALIDGKYHKVDTSNSAMYAGMREKGNDIVLTIINLKDVVIENPSFKFKGDLPLGKYTIKILIGNEGVDPFIEIVSNGDYLEFTFSESIGSHQNLVLQLIPEE